MSSRKVLLHYHFFKNAGTSLDAALKEGVADGEWLTREFPNHRLKNAQEVAHWITENRKCKFFSSHTAWLPVPTIEDVEVLPVLFIRHPVDRIVSVYNFEAKQGHQTFGSALASSTSLSGYVEKRLSIENDRQCRNFHTQRLAMMFPEPRENEFKRAMKAVRRLPFVGVVEHFDESIRQLEAVMMQHGFGKISLKAHQKNATRKTHLPLEERLKQLKNDLGNALYQDLLKANRDDLKLYQRTLETRYAGIAVC